MLLLDGKRLITGRAFSSNGVSYPANWLDLTSRQQHEEIGIVYQDDPVSSSWDKKWAWGYLDSGELNWKDFDDKKSQLLDENNSIAGSLLHPTDYTVTRKYEKGTAIPADTSSFRDEVRRINDEREAAINATKTTEELFNIREFSDLPYPGGVAEWKATREAAAKKAAEEAAAKKAAEEAAAKKAAEEAAAKSSESSESSESSAE